MKISRFEPFGDKLPNPRNSMFFVHANVHVLVRVRGI